MLARRRESMDPLSEPIEKIKGTMILENSRSTRFFKAVTFAVVREKPLIFANTSECGDYPGKSFRVVNEEESYPFTTADGTEK
jgi:hypothetical protein